MSNKKQTAVEWLLSELDKRLSKIQAEPNGIVRETMIENLLSNTEQFKEIEQGQIMDAINFGQNNHTVSISTDSDIAEQHYKENYEK